MGSRATTSWLIGSLVGLAVTLLVSMPLQIFLNGVALADTVNFEIVELSRHLNDRALVIMTRKTGLVTNTNSLIHQVNPACRVAREFPHLAISRLLISLNDGDFPLHFGGGRKKHTWLSYFLEAVVTLILTIIKWMPDLAIDAAFAGFATVLTDAAMILLAWATNYGMYVPMVAVAALVVLLCAREIKIHLFDKKRFQLWEDSSKRSAYRLMHRVLETPSARIMRDGYHAVLADLEALESGVIEEVSE